MKFVADLHIHSKYSRATSREMDLVSLAKAAQRKGIKVLATGDFTHPVWFRELKTKLEPAALGLFQLQGDNSGTLFILSAEISCIYSKGGKVRRIHLVVLAPSLEAVEKLNAILNLRGNLKSDGRPILGLDAQELTKIILNTSPECVVVPAHIWTPWFSLFGSKSGFDTIEECFGDYAPYIFAMETGLSSDPAMNWRLSALDRIALISNSDSHSAAKLGREANIFDTDLSYPAIVEALKTKNPRKFLYTIEFFPQEGKYHYDGHRSCKISFSPQETKKHQGICPVCKRPLTIGVLNRVDELADRPEGERPQGAIPFKNLIPLGELIAEALGVGVLSKAVKREYDSLVNKFGNEFAILLEIDIDDLKKQTLSEIAEAIFRMRQGKVKVEAGYDGEYGKIKIFSDEERQSLNAQRALF
ncbi:MAG: endonuclease Q family protein [Candidatus Pacebacteria bacterium]|nr:endonuclease Q family protein [Candidatus Paceibacterota bacterium]